MNTYKLATLTDDRQLDDELKEADAREAADNAENAKRLGEIHQEGLPLEQEHAVLLREHGSLKKRYADLITKHERLQMSNTSILDESKETSRELDILKKNASGAEHSNHLEVLNKKLDEANGLIAQQEGQIDDDRVIKERQKKELDKLRPSAGRLQKLEDELRELKTENTSLLKKANTVDNLQRKIDTQSGVEKENARLHERIDVLEGNQKDYDRVYTENEQLKLTAAQYNKRFQAYELEAVERDAQKKALEEDLRTKQHLVESLQEKHRHDEAWISDMQEQMLAANVRPGDHSPPSGGVKASPMTLEEELALSGDSSANYPLEISRLRAEIQLLKTNSGGLTNAELRNTLEEIEQQKTVLLEKNTEMMEAYAITKKQLDAVLQKSENEKLVEIRSHCLTLLHTR